MKKSITSLLLAVIMLLTMASPAFAAGEDFTFKIELDKDSVEVGEKVKVTLVISSNDGQPYNIYTMQDYVYFDIEYFEFVDGSINIPGGDDSAIKATFQGERIYVSRYGVAPYSTESGDAEIMSFELKAIAPGDAEFSHAVVELADNTLNLYDVELEDANITVEGEESEETDAPSTPTTKTYTIKEDSYGDAEAHGRVNVRSRAAKGTTVRIEVEPDEGYEVDEVIVYDKDGDELRVTDKGNGIYTFTMPGGKVTYTVTYKKVTETEAPETDAPETEAPETEAPETDAPETDAPKVPDTPSHECPSAAYTDVDQTKWYHDAIDYAITEKLMNGVSATSFNPDGTTTRAMIATILYRVAGSPATDAAMPFSDVAEGQWYYDAVRWAAANGIVNGMGGDIFAPDLNITREQFATMLYRFEQYKGGGYAPGWSYKLDFTDAGSVSSWANEAVCWCNENKILNGMGEGLLVPAGNATRAQAAQMLKNYNTRS